jgi:Ran-binding protein 1
MSDATEAKPTPSATQSASSEPRIAKDETEMLKNPSGDASTEAPNKHESYAETATNAASNVASTATAAAAGVKDSVFSMFGGGAKKEKKVEGDDDAKDEPSGSSKAKKEDDEVQLPKPLQIHLTNSSCRRSQTRRSLMWSSSL